MPDDTRLLRVNYSTKNKVVAWLDAGSDQNEFKEGKSLALINHLFQLPIGRLMASCGFANRP